MLKINIIILVFCLFFAVDASSEVSQTLNKSTESFFDILLYGLNQQRTTTPKMFPELSSSNEVEVREFIKIQLNTTEKIAEGSNDNRKFIQSNYDNYFIVCEFGNNSNEWNDKLYSISFNITYESTLIPDKRTGVFNRIKNIYGDYSRLTKFKRGDFNLYVWDIPGYVITYRVIRDHNLNNTATVVTFWDSEFYKTNLNDEM